METKVLGDKHFVTKQGVYLFNGDQIGVPDLRPFYIEQDNRVNHYESNYDIYAGQHAILKKAVDPDSWRPDNRLVSNWGSYVVDTYSGYFMGRKPTISLDETTTNDRLQDWLNESNLLDILTECSKQISIYGRSYLLGFQDERSRTNTISVEPTNGFMIYTTSVKTNPIGFVRYNVYNNKRIGELYTDHEVIEFEDDRITGRHNHLFGEVPAVELYANIERLSLIDKIKSLVETYDNVLSQKANQNEYFDNALLKILGIPFEHDDNGQPIIDLKNRVLVAEDPDSKDGVIDFVPKPDNDGTQENLLNRIKDDIFQTAMVANLNDESFSGNLSGVAIKYKLLPMQNQALNEERKFTIALREFLSTLLSLGQIIGTADKDSLMRDLTFKFYRNAPEDLANEADAAQKLNGIVSEETQLSTLSFVDDPKTEMQRMKDEGIDKALTAVKTSASATDLIANQSGGLNGQENKPAN